MRVFIRVLLSRTWDARRGILGQIDVRLWTLVLRGRSLKSPQDEGRGTKVDRGGCMRAWIAVSAVVASAAFVSIVAVRGQERPLVLEGGTLIDGTGRTPITNAVIVVDGTRIKTVGVKGQVTYPANANVIRFDGRTILPGLIDGHVHLRDYQVPMFLPYGVTTIADIHND